MIPAGVLAAIQANATTAEAKHVMINESKNPWPASATMPKA
jgi:hypothetical protein